MLDLKKIFKKLGIQTTDNLMMHSDLTFLKKKKPYHERYNLFFESLIKEIPDGNLIVPSFTFNFCQNRVFDLKKSPSETGMFANFLIKKNFLRTNHPIFSFVIYGNDSLDLAKNISTDAFGKNSIFDKLYKKEKSKILFMNCSFQRCTFCHYVEQNLSIPYRYQKNFKGKVINNKKSYEKEFSYFVRPLDGTINYDLTKLENLLIEKNKLIKIKIDSIYYSVVNVIDFVNLTTKALKEDPFFLLTDSRTRK